RLEGLSIAESAVNDALGAIFVAALSAMILAGTAVDSGGALTAGLSSSENLLNLGQQILFGAIAGLIGWGIMYGYERYKAADNERGKGETAYDFALVLAVPLVTFVLAQAIHGNGFLAAFISGLMASYNHH